MKISPSKMMYSIGLVTVATSYTIMPIGPYAATFIEDNGYLMEYGITDYQFTMFTQMNIKVFVALFVLIWAIFFAPKFAPDQPLVPINMMETRKKAQKEPLSPVREVIGYVVFFGVIVCLIFQSFGLPSWIIPACGAAFLVLSGVLTEREAINNMCLDIIMLYVGVVTLGSAFANTGAGELVGDAVAGLLGGVHNSYVIGAIFFLAAFVMTSLLYNRAVSKILIPLVILTAMSLKCDPRDGRRRLRSEGAAEDGLDTVHHHGRDRRAGGHDPVPLLLIPKDTAQRLLHLEPPFCVRTMQGTSPLLFMGDGATINI